MEVEKANYPIALMCRVLGVSRSAYYAWRGRPRPTVKEREDAELLQVVHAVHSESRHTYGRPRIQHALRRRGHHVGTTRLRRLMKTAGVAGKVRRRFRKTTDSEHGMPVADNLLDREFSQETADAAWCADITYLRTEAGWAYLAAILDLGTRLVVGWSVQDHMRTDLIDRALEGALAWRDPAREMLHHSDRGSQYASERFQARLAKHGITCSMSRRGNCWDNAVMESFFGTFKQELASEARWANVAEARAATHDYIEVFYNRKRLHSSLNYRTPMEADEALALSTKASTSC